MKTAKIKYGIYLGKEKLFLERDRIVEVIEPEESDFNHFKKLEISPDSKYVLIRYNPEREVLVDKWELIF